MTPDEVREIVAEVLEIEPAELETQTDLRDFDTFDSVNVLLLVVALDERAGIRLSPNDVQKIQHYGDIEAIARAQGIVLS